MEQVWLEKWRDEGPLREGLVDWEVFKAAFLDRFFPLELRERKLVEFMNLRQGGMIVNDYSVKVTQFSMYAPTLVSNSRDIMNNFVMGVSSMVEKECHTAMLQNDMDISRLMVYYH